MSQTRRVKCQQQISTFQRLRAFLSGFYGFLGLIERHRWINIHRSPPFSSWFPESDQKAVFLPTSLLCILSALSGPCSLCSAGSCRFEGEHTWQYGRWSAAPSAHPGLPSTSCPASARPLQMVFMRSEQIRCEALMQMKRRSGGQVE